MITVAIEYTGSPNFPVLLVQLQPQLHPDDDIYIVDKTPDRSALKICELYGSTRCYIFVEVSRGIDVKTAGEQSARENRQISTIVLNENAVISATLIHNIKRSFRNSEQTRHPEILETPYPKMPANFSWYNQDISQEQVVILPYNSRQSER